MATELTRIPPALKKRSRELRKAMTEAEQRLWMHLRRSQLKGCRFRRQHPCGVYVLDFVCLEAKLVIEVDGGQHVQQMDREPVEPHGWNSADSESCVSGTPIPTFPLPGGRRKRGCRE